MGRDRRGSDLLLDGGDRARRHRDLLDRLDELLDRAIAEVEAVVEIAHVRRQSRPEDVGSDLGGDGGLVELAAARAGPRAGPVLGADRGLLGQLGDLMSTRLGVAGAGFGRREAVAAGANRGDVGDEPVDAPGG